MDLIELVANVTKYHALEVYPACTEDRQELMMLENNYSGNADLVFRTSAQKVKFLADTIFNRESRSNLSQGFYVRLKMDKNKYISYLVNN